MIAGSAGISRATFFNHLAKKDLIHELAAARAERVSQMFAALRESTQLEVCRENARFSFQSKELLLDAISHQLSRGLILTAREEAPAVLTEGMTSFIRDKTYARLVAETVFCVFLGTMLEWLMREDVPEKWLVETMRNRVEVLLEASL
jgi:AcrR family transcriptional regulator